MHIERLVLIATILSGPVLGCDSKDDSQDKQATETAPPPAAAPAATTPAAPPATATEPVIATPPATPPEPAPDESQTASTCKHVVDVVRQSKPTEDQVLLAQVQRDCEATLDEIENRHRSLTACMLATGTPAEIEDCEKSAQHYDSVLRAVGPGFEDICDHVMEVMKRELGDAATMPSEDDMARFTAECVKELAREKEKIGDEEYRKQAACVLQAQALEEMAKCEDK